MQTIARFPLALLAAVGDVRDQNVDRIMLLKGVRL